MYIEVTGDYKFMRCGGSDRLIEQGLTFHRTHYRSYRGRQKKGVKFIQKREKDLEKEDDELGR